MAWVNEFSFLGEHSLLIMSCNAPYNALYDLMNKCNQSYNT